MTSGWLKDSRKTPSSRPLLQWPGEGVQRIPGAWLMTIAKRRAVDRFRRQQRLDVRHQQV
jgi:predicted RNA polymerase sigma factor